MAFFLPLPSGSQLVTTFTIPDVRTKSSLAEPGEMELFHEKIKRCSREFKPRKNYQYIVCVRVSCTNQRGCPLSDAEHVTTSIVYALFPDCDSINIVKGVQTEAEMTAKTVSDEKTEVFIYAV
ncbi:hypothetical protein [Candidatus Electronema sp. PJ]|uniref:hypothetical protein n=1 Tax=Candidatus Electronema sp. PJ TaxID=3401572 RepID=UPI003AA97999